MKVNNEGAKPATQLHAGDLVAITGKEKDRVLEVLSFPERRKGAPEAALAYVDLSPAPAPRISVPRREPGSGRPTKRERRQVDKLRGR